MIDQHLDTNASDLDVIYRNQLVAFIDILGFSKLVNYTDLINRGKVSKIVNFVRDFILEQEKIFKGDSLYLNVSFISDSIVISVDAPSSVNDLTFLHFLKISGAISLYFLTIGVACRGSIVCGQIFHHRESNFNTVVGSALVEANKIKRKDAIYPRIIIDNSASPFWDEWLAAEEHKEQWSEVMKQDQDGKRFINVFHNIFENVIEFLFCFRGHQDHYDILKMAGESIIEGLKDPDPRVREKYAWLQGQYRGNCLM